MSEVTDKEILEARKQMAAKFGNTQLGGKGTQRRKKWQIDQNQNSQPPIPNPQSPIPIIFAKRCNIYFICPIIFFTLLFLFFQKYILKMINNNYSFITNIPNLRKCSISALLNEYV